MSAILNLPDIRPSLLLDFANSGQVDPRIQCTRASSATCYGSTGVMRTVGANVPRIDFDPLTGQCRGLLIESSVTNLALYSHNFSNAAWSKGHATVNANGRLTENDTNNGHFLSQAHPFSVGEPCTFIVQAKHDPSSPSKRYLTLLLPAAWFGVNARATFDLENGTFTTESSPQRVSMARQVDGSYLCSVTHTATVTDPAAPQIRLSPSPTGTLDPYTGDNASGLYLICANITKTATPSSIIRSEGASATRAADAIQMPLGDWFNPNEGTFLIEFMAGNTGIGRLISADVGVSDLNRLAILKTIGGAAQILMSSDGAAATSNQINPEGLNKVVATYRQNSLAISMNGGPVAKDTTATLPSGLSRAMLGGQFDGSAMLNGALGRVTYCPRQLTDAQLQRMSAL